MLARATLNVSRSSWSDTPLQRKRGGLKREHDLFDAFEGIRGLPPGRARLRKWRPSHALEASGVALTWPWRGPDVALTWVWRAGAVLVSGPNPSRT